MTSSSPKKHQITKSNRYAKETSRHYCLRRFVPHRRACRIVQHHKNRMGIRTKILWHPGNRGYSSGCTDGSTHNAYCHRIRLFNASKMVILFGLVLCCRRPNQFYFQFHYTWIRTDQNHFHIPAHPLRDLPYHKTEMLRAIIY